MDNKLSQAVKVGIKCGIVIALIYLVIGFAGQWLNNTPAMKSYTDNMAQYNKNLWNDTYGSGFHSQVSPQPPLEYYISLLLGMLSFIVTVLGLLAIGILAVRGGGQAKYSLNDVAYMGVFAGVAAFVPYFVALIIQMVTMYFWNGSYMGSLTSIMPGVSAILPFVMFGETFCCCLPSGIAIFAIISTIGASGYALFAKKLEDKPEQV
jgi:hypothetical protein